MITKHIADYKKYGVNVFAIPKTQMYSVDWKKWETERNNSIIPEGNLGIVLGKISDNLMVIDVKSKELAENIFPKCFEKTLVVMTASGGYHIYLKLPTLENDGKTATDFTVVNDSSQRIEFRVSGYVIGAGSVDTQSRQYQVMSDVREPLLVSTNEIFTNAENLGFKSSKLAGFKSATSLQQSETYWLCLSCDGELDENGKEKHITGKKYQDPIFESCKEMRHEIKMFNDGDAVISNAFVTKVQELLRAGVRTEGVREQMQEWNVQNGSKINDVVFENKLVEIISKFDDNSQAVDTDTVDQSEMTNTDFANQVMKKRIYKCMIDNKDLLYYEDGVYVYNNREAENQIEEELDKSMQETTVKRVTEIIACVKRKTFVQRKNFDKDLELINCRNGIVNAVTGELKQHSPDYLFRNQCPVDYKPDYTYPKAFFDFLQVSIGDPKQIIQLVESMACCLLRTSKFQKAFMHIGSGSNGKSTFLSLLEQIIGDRNIAHVSPHQLERERFATAELENKMLNVYADIVSETLTSTGKLKMVISGDNVAGERKHRDPFNFSPYAKLMFSANQLPDVEDQTNAMYRRWIIFKWSQKFEGVNQDRHLLQKLTTNEELSNIFSMLVEVAKTLISNNYKFRYEPTPDEVKQMWQDHADPVDTFIKEKTHRMESGYCVAVKMYSAYTQYCKEREIDAKERKYFYKKFSGLTNIEKTAKRMGGAVERVFEGITLTSEIIDENKTQGQGSLFEGDDG
ncbi:phage/plasmid primase, P4 family [Candidatus Nitrosopelagicus sp.]|nr:phage/plasmid primase, P4 family [Candidatus Nitrosopelagicus sp.]